MRRLFVWNSTVPTKSLKGDRMYGNDYDAHLEAAYEALFENTMEESDEYDDVESVQEEIVVERERRRVPR